MIDVAKSEEELNAPAATDEELFQRLAPYVGYTVLVCGFSRMFSARLDKVDLEKGKNQYYVYSYFGDNRLNDGLLYSLSVLIDGQWKILHEPAPKAERVID